MLFIPSFKDFFEYLKRKWTTRVELDRVAKETLDVVVKEYQEVHVRFRNGKYAILTKYKRGRVRGVITQRDFFPRGEKWKWMVTGESGSFNPDYDIVRVIEVKGKR